MNLDDIDAGDVGAALGAIASVGAAIAAAPAIGALLSTAGLGVAGGALSGAAASNAGLAFLGGGSLASGGLGMAGGTTIIGATGGLAGGSIGHEIGKNLDAIKDQAEEAQAVINSTISPEPSYFSQLTELGSESMEAAGLSLAVNLLPELASGTAAALRGEMTIAEVANSIGTKLRTNGLKVGGDAFAKSGLSGVLASTDAFDPTGAVLVVTLAVDIAKYAFALNKGEINSDEFAKLAKETIVNKGSSILLTSAAIGLVGPAGLITPLIVASLIKNAKIREQVSSALDAAFANAEELIQKQIEIIRASQQTNSYAQETSSSGQQASDAADAGINASKSSIKALEDKLAKQNEIRNRISGPKE